MTSGTFQTILGIRNTDIQQRIPMKSRLALVAFRGAGAGPWVRSRGNETGIRVQGLADGERVISFIEMEGVIQLHSFMERNDTYPLPDRWSKIMFEKRCDSEGCGNTQVELLVA